MVEKKSAAIYQCGGKLALCAESRTTRRLWVIHPESTVLSQEDVTDAALGEALLKVLETSRSGVPFPDADEMKRRVRALVAPFGFKSWTALVRSGALSCSVYREGDVLRFNPLRNKGRGFEGVKGWDFTIPADSPLEAVGAAARKAMEIAQCPPLRRRVQRRGRPWKSPSDGTRSVEVAQGDGPPMEERADEHEMPEKTIAEEMQDCAEAAVALARDTFETELDFSEESLQEVERILGILRKDVSKNWLSKLLRLGPSEQQIWKLADILGGYVGEVIRRRWGGEWTTESALAVEPMITLRVGSHEIWPPIRVYKRLTLGSDNNVWHYYCLLKRKFGATQ